MAHEDHPDTESLHTLALYNYGHYTSMLVTDRRVRGLALHLRRLAADSVELFRRQVDTDEVLRQVRAFLAANPGDTVVRVTVYAADFTMQHPGEADDLRILVTSRPAPTTSPAPVALGTVPFVRELPRAKHVGLFGQLWSRRTAQLAGHDDALLVDADGLIVEGATWNIGFIRGDGHVVWPRSDALPGVTLALVRAEYERQHPGRSSEQTVHLNDLDDCAAAFTTNAVSGVRPVKQIDGHKFDVNADPLSTLTRCYAEVVPDPV